MSRHRKNADGDKVFVRVSLSDRTSSAVFSAICADAKDPDACQRYVDRLEQASLNIDRTDQAPPS